MKSNLEVLKAIANVEPRDCKFFKVVMNHMVDDLFSVGKKKEIVCEQLNIAIATYWRRVNSLIKRAHV